jgi:hypothetical protein
MGFNIKVKLTGAFYVFVNAKHLSADSYKLAFDILEKAHVGVTQGIDFGTNGEGFLRFSYANSIENIEEGMNRLEKYLKQVPINYDAPVILLDRLAGDIKTKRTGLGEHLLLYALFRSYKLSNKSIEASSILGIIKFIQYVINLGSKIIVILY